MNITKEMDSFDVLHLNDDATESEIKQALKLHVDMFCGADGNKRNAEGEYLFNIYYYHFKKLMDSKEREKLLEMRKNKPKMDQKLEKTRKNEVLVSSISEAKQRHIITSVNQEIIQKYSAEMSKGRFKLYRKKISLKDVYIVFGEDSSLLFVRNVYSGDAKAKKKNPETGEVEILEGVGHYELLDCFTDQNILENIMWAWFERPWTQGQIFRVNGIFSTAILASKAFPHALIHNQKILECDFRKSYDIIHNYLSTNAEYVKSIFEDVDEEEVDRRMR